MLMDNLNSVHAINLFEKEGHVERYNFNFRLIDLTTDDLHDMGITTIEE